MMVMVMVMREGPEASDEGCDACQPVVREVRDRRGDNDCSHSRVE